jgi:hypothetical protein
VTIRFDHYLNDVERFFYLVRMSGFILSPRDVERVREWYLRGIPLQVVVEGILEGVRQYRYKAGPQDRLPHQLSFYSHHIGARVRSYRTAPSQVTLEAGSNGRDDENLTGEVAHLHRELELLVEREERELEREIKGLALERLHRLTVELAESDDESSLEYALQVLDDDILALYHSRLDETAQQTVRQETEALLAREPGLGQRALEGRREALKQRVLRSRLQMLEWTP